MISFLAILTALVLSLRLLNVSADTLVWVLGLFAAAFGFSARPIVSDILTGIGFLFENPYDVSEKIEIMPGVQGVVEGVNLRTTLLRAHSGELYIVPNGEVRLVRNFSRGRFSMADVKLILAAADLDRALPLLEDLGREAVTLLPNLLEPWQIISETGVIGAQTELTLSAKARFGKAADMRPRLLSLVQKRLEEAGITLAS
jgi:small conductance mechanosensitive channel